MWSEKTTTRMKKIAIPRRFDRIFSLLFSKEFTEFFLTKFLVFFVVLPGLN